MMGPDYTHWHGTYEVARNFYTEFIPELEELAHKGLSSGDPKKIAAAPRRPTVARKPPKNSKPGTTIDDWEPSVRARGTTNKTRSQPAAPNPIPAAGGPLSND